jgi:hypothetical protein
VIADPLVSEQVNWARYDPTRATGHYESFYLRGNDPTRPLAFWLRYTIFSPTGRPDDALGELWAVVFDRDSGVHTRAKVEVPLAECTFATTSFDVRVAGAVLDAERARGSAGQIAWDLRYEGGQPPLYLLPRRLYRGGFPKAKSLVSRPLARFTGRLTVGGETIEVDGWPGSQNHNWGSRHTDRYAFGQVAGFDDAPDSFLEVATARNRVGPLWTPALTLLVLRDGGREHALTSIRQAFRATARLDPYAWTFATQDDRVKVRGRIQADPADVVLLEYRNPPGGTKYCLNTKLARCELTVTDLASGATKALTSSHGALYEVLGDEPPAASTVH